MTKRADKGYLVPIPVDPGEYEAFCVYIPKHTWYIGAFWAAYQYFTSWLAWARDPLHRGRQAASVWRGAYDLARSQYEAGLRCGMAITDLRTDPLNPCALQVSTDSGATWTTVADFSCCGGGSSGGCDVLRFDGVGVQRYDPALQVWGYTAPIEPLPEIVEVSPLYIGVEGGNCLAAANASRWLIEVENQFLNSSLDALTFNGIAAAIAGYLTSAIGLIPATWVAGLADALTEAAYIIYANILAVDIESDLKCILQNCFDPDGSMSLNGYLSAKFQVNEQYAAAATATAEKARWGLTSTSLLLAGPANLVKMSKSANITVDDCEECGWRVTFDFEASNQAWYADTDAGSKWGAYTPLTGWHATVQGTGAGFEIKYLYLTRTFPPATVTRIRTDYNAVIDTGLASADIQTRDQSGALQTTALITGDLQSEIWAGSSSTNMIEIRAGLVNNYPDGNPTGDVLITAITLEGTGPNPFL